MNAAPIGFFDSGVGGLSVWQAVVTRLPGEATAYLSDNAHCPYGPRSAAEVVALSFAATDRLLALGCKAVVVACNTATAAAIDALRARHATPFVGMEPAVKPAALESRSGVVGILATEGTFRGRPFRETAARHAGGVRLVVREAHGLVGWVESGRAGTPGARAALEEAVRPMLTAGADRIVLGCTHFAFLRPALEDIAGPGVRVLDPSDAVARQVERVLAAAGLAAPPRAGPAPAAFLATGTTDRLEHMLRTTLGVPDARVWPADRPLGAAACAGPLDGFARPVRR